MRIPRKGNVGEAKVLCALLERGFDVLVPFGEGHAYDLVLSIRDERFVRVQCKTAWPRGGCLIFNSRTTDHGRGRRSYLGLADVFGVYYPPDRGVYLVPVTTVPAFEGRLRLEPARNNQRKGVRHAGEYELDRWTEDALAAVA